MTELKLDVDLLRRLHRQWNDTEAGISPVECDQVMAQIPEVLAVLDSVHDFDRILSGLPVCDRWDVAAFRPCWKCTACTVRAALVKIRHASEGSSVTTPRGLLP